MLMVEERLPSLLEHHDKKSPPPPPLCFEQVSAILLRVPTLRWGQVRQRTIIMISSPRREVADLQWGELRDFSQSLFVSTLSRCHYRSYGSVQPCTVTVVADLSLFFSSGKWIVLSYQLRTVHKHHTLSAYDQMKWLYSTVVCSQLYTVLCTIIHVVFIKYQTVYTTHSYRLPALAESSLVH